ncbi:aldo-keto reductase family 1 member B7-like isoform X1 [Anopheles merus]|uniref:aldo-keto reductase family 1 member B7-like isoform X1 n=1 Tax=Anopheles merus TaxID=30066 RepID=UPI001BE4CD1B|nr:aldo-keto reductase family 1 member B7-like isoform X1 [Anopheles merus]
MIPKTCINLSDQHSIALPTIGLGTYSILGADGKEAIRTAIDVGYRMFDTAVAYGNETIVGEAIREKIRECNNLTRDDFFIISKLSGSYHRMDLVEKCCRMTLDRLGMDYVDLYLMHTPVALQSEEKCTRNGTKSNAIDDSIAPTEASLGLEQCYQEGLCRSIGVSNFNEHQINALLSDASIVPAVNQIECSIGFNQRLMRKFCQQQNILVMGYTPLGKQKLPFLQNNRLKEIALSVDKTTAQVSLRYLIDEGVVPIVKSTDRKRQQENLDIFDFMLTKQQLEELDAIGGDQRACKMGFLAGAKHFPFTDY